MTQSDPVKSQGRPAAVRAKPLRPRPVINEDVAFFWEGVQRGELLIQRCAGCGQLWHPPRPMCASSQSVEWNTVKSTGRGTIKSFVVLHYPEFPNTHGGMLSEAYIHGVNGSHAGVRLIRGTSVNQPKKIVDHVLVTSAPGVPLSAAILGKA